MSISVFPFAAFDVLLLLLDAILLYCSDSPVATTKVEEEAVNSPGAEHSREAGEPQDSHPEGEGVRRTRLFGTR